MTDMPIWLRIILYAIGIAALAGLTYTVVWLAVRQALRPGQQEARAARRRQEDVLRDIANSASYIADVADAWAEGEAERRAADQPPAVSSDGVTTTGINSDALS